MGLGGIGIKELLVILVIVVLIFGTKRLSSLGSDLGTAIRGFRKSVSEDDKGESKPDEKRIAEEDQATTDVIQGEAQRSEEKH
jgi:sec-independent protein translocase protein TatA